MNVIYIDHITRHYIQTNKTSLFIFGDNDIRCGLGGQASKMRGEPNSYGIRVKKLPNMTREAFYTDLEYDENIKKIEEDIKKIRDLMASKKYRCLVIPSSGIGTGLAQLDIHAPKTKKFLDDTISNLITYLRG